MPRTIWSYVRNPRATIAIAHSVAKQWLINQPLFAELRRKVVPVPNPAKWVFIVGCYNSGTTILLNMLAQHPSISVLDEGVFRTNELITPEELGWTRMWCKVQDKVRLGVTDTHVDAIAVQKDWSFFLDVRKPILVEKSIVNSARLPWLQANFPNSYFIFIVRNGYAVAEGIQRKVINRRYSIPAEFGETYPIELCAQQWVQTNEIVEEDSPSIERIYRLTYEELCSNPKGTLDAIWQFLEIDNKYTNFNQHQEWQIHGQKSPLRNMNQRSIKKLSKEERHKVKTIAGEMLQRYRYDTENH